MAVNDHTAFSWQLTARWSTATDVSFVNWSTSSATWIGWQGLLYTGYPSRQTINGCVCNGLMSAEPGPKEPKRKT
ncbi:hypothetical protein TNCV_5016901 [Trichonephila clavipes]|nr:hypothetical protein TNCV_5016901 [Trichonephila clavipes]